MMYPVSECMLVSFLRQDIASLLTLNRPVHLLVGFSWLHDVLDHEGTITDRVLPGTGTPCPYLQQGSRVNVYLARPPPGIPLSPLQDSDGVNSGESYETAGERSGERNLLSNDDALALLAATSLHNVTP